ncbi:MAG: SRPBCC domain-containing protein [Flavobacteriales bacterium]|nr:SRPBCC domain-containing protein [Flavobacteriales bacterium]
MTKQITTSINIKASREQVWKTLMDFQSYPKWNSFIKEVSGDVQVGNKIHVDLQGMIFKPEVLILEKNSEFKWQGSLWFKGLFDGQHEFKLVDNGDGTTKFIHGEFFKGLLVKLLSKKIDTEVVANFERMNEELKAQVEQNQL